MIKLAVIGTGGAAHGHARSFQKFHGVRLVAACDIDRPKAVAFAKKFGIPEVYDDPAELLRRADCDAVTIVTSDAAHAPVALAAAAAGKHILCEKPLALNYHEAARMTAAVARHRVINMVNFSYRNSSAIQRAHTLVAKGVIGRPLHFEASYLQSWLSSTVWGDWRKNPAFLWRLSTRHGSGGVLGDVGVHILDFAGYPVGDYRRVYCRLETFSKAKGARLGPYRLDANDSALINAELANGALGVVHTTRWASGHANSVRLRLYGDEGGLVIDLDRGGDLLELCAGEDRHKARWRTVKCPRTPNVFERFLRSIRTGVNDQPDFARGAAIQKVLDACFESSCKNQPVRI